MTSFPLQPSRLVLTSIRQSVSPVRASPPLETVIAPPLQPRTDRPHRDRSNSPAANAGDRPSCPETRPCPRPKSGGKRQVRILVGTTDGRDDLPGRVASQRLYVAHLNAQTNGKLERWHKSLKSECIRPGTPLTREDALRLIQTYVEHYNTVRLHSAIGYVTPHDMLAGRQAAIHAARDRKLEEARHQRQLRREARSLLAHSSNTTTMTSPGETEAGSAGMQPC
jgi:hypothetical protein